MISSVVIKLGGSILYDEDLNFNIKFVEKFVAWFRNQKEYEKVVFVVGGGRLSRFLINQLDSEVKLDSLKHRIGINVTKVNASIVFSLFNQANIKVFDDIEKLSNSIKNSNVDGAIIGGIKEGWSTDMVAAHVSKNLGLDCIYKFSDIDYIYSADPKLQKDAKSLTNLSWDEYIDLFYKQIGQKHMPSMNAPIDINCALYCQKNKLQFRVLGGKVLEGDFKVSEMMKTGTLVL